MLYSRPYSSLHFIFSIVIVGLFFFIYYLFNFFASNIIYIHTGKLKIKNVTNHINHFTLFIQVGI